MKCALLLIDIQNDYFENGKMVLAGTAQAGENAGKILHEFRKKNNPVIHIRHIAAAPGASFFLPDTEGSEIHQYVKPLANEKVIIKHFPNSFRNTELLDYLQSQNITDLVICGMMTHLCVDATVRAAKDFGFTCLVIGDACATKDLEINGETVKAPDVQKSFLAALNYFYSTVISTEKYLADSFSV